MQTARDLDSSDVAWLGFLDHVKRIWESATREYAALPGFAKWRSEVEKFRDSSPLLRYMFQARHATNHGLTNADSLKLEQGGVGINPGPDGIISNMEIQSTPDGIVIKSDKPYSLSIFRPSACLVPVVNRGVEYSVPEVDLAGAPLKGSPLHAASATLEFYESKMKEMEAQFAAK